MSDQHDHDCGGAESHELDRRTFVRGCGAAMALAVAGTSVGDVAAEASGDIETLLADAPTNWGRWGEDDELGALNLLGSEEAFAGMRAATQRGAKGIQRFPLQLSVTGEVINPDPDRPDVVFPDGEAAWPSTDIGDPAFPPRTPGRRDNTTAVDPDPLAGGVTYVDDKFVTDFFLQGTTHMDALGHAWYGDQLYNGFSARTTETEKEFETALQGTQRTDSVPGEEECLDPVSGTRGLARADVAEAASEGIAGRGVLLDVGRQFGDEDGRLDLGTGVTFEDLQATAEAQETTIEERDILLVRTGAAERTRDPAAEWAPLDEPGLVYSPELVEWVAEMDIPYIGADNLAVEKVVQTIDGDTYVIPLHGAFLRNLGVYLNEILDLRALGEACAADGIYEFLFTAAPLNVERASGAPINPLVLKATDA
jgi:kynurenine formamidase